MEKQKLIIDEIDGNVNENLSKEVENLSLFEDINEFEQSSLRVELEVSTDVAETPISVPNKFPDFRQPKKFGPSDFEILRIIGIGAYGKVLQVRSRRNGQICAMKCISKKLIHRKSHFSYLKAERDILARVDHPFIVGLKCAFQTDTKLFLVMEYLRGGELFYHLNKMGLILEKNAVFYAAEVVLALEHLHSIGIIHRDLKPENILLGEDGHICLTDFGLAKEFEPDGESGFKTICGTNEYMAPEMILRSGYGKAVDWWSLGALIFEMMTGDPPFRGKNSREINEHILAGKIKLPNWISAAGVSIVKSLLERDVSRRLGATRTTMFEIGGVASIKHHKFFRSVDWAAFLDKQVNPPFIPKTPDGEADSSNFYEDYKSMRLTQSFCEDSKAKSFAETDFMENGALNDYSHENPDLDESNNPQLNLKNRISNYILPDGKFRNFSFVADKFDFESGNWIPVDESEQTNGSPELDKLDNGFYVGPLLKFECTKDNTEGIEDTKLTEKKKKKKKKKNEKSKRDDFNTTDVSQIPEEETKKEISTSISSMVLAAVVSTTRQTKSDALNVATVLTEQRSVPSFITSLAQLLKNQEANNIQESIFDSSANEKLKPIESIWKTTPLPRPAKVPKPELRPPSTKSLHSSKSYLNTEPSGNEYEGTGAFSFSQEEITLSSTMNLSTNTWASKLAGQATASKSLHTANHAAVTNKETKGSAPQLVWSNISRRGVKNSTTKNRKPVSKQK